MPNYLVFDRQYGSVRANQINLQTGETEEMDCVYMYYRLVHREILAPNERYPNEEMMERTLLPTEPLEIPVDMLPLFITHQRIQANLPIINLALSNFAFRGVLEGLVLSVDETVLSDILNSES